jgi:alpha-ketoglutarate-dependent taurine dioxygenase
MPMRIHDLTPSLGGEVTGVDLSRPLGDDEARAIEDALARRGVLVFRGQALTDQAQVDFARHFGELGVFRPAGDPSGLPPEIYRVANTDPSGNLLPIDGERARVLALNSYWHIDGSYRSVPPKGAILHGIEVVEEGGETVFANLAAAYEELPVAEKERLIGLLAVHSFEFQVVSRGLPPMSDEERARLPAVRHPVVRRLPDGRRSLYLSPPYMETIVGWPQPESLALLSELAERAAQDRFTYHHRWRPGDLVLWDNGWTMHRAASYDVGRRRRVLHGTLLLGSQPVEPATA